MSDGRLIDAALAFVLFMATCAALDAFRTPKTRVVLRHLRPSDFLRALPVLGGAVALLVVAIQWIPYGNVGWWSLLGGQGNVLLGQAAPMADPSWIQKVAPWACLALLMFTAPSLVRIEECWFRRGADRMGVARGILRQSLFGASHLLVGVPIGAAVALTGVGLVFQRSYRRAYAARRSRFDALMASTRLHLAYNYIAFGIAALALLLSSLGGR